MAPLTGAVILSRFPVVGLLPVSWAATAQGRTRSMSFSTMRSIRQKLCSNRAEEPVYSGSQRVHNETITAAAVHPQHENLCIASVRIFAFRRLGLQSNRIGNSRSNRRHVEDGFRRRDHERRDHSPISCLWTPR